MTETSQDNLVLMAEISAAHGIRGQVKLRSFAEPPDRIAKYGKLLDAKGNPLFSLKIVSSTPTHLIAQLEGVTDRNQAEKLVKTKLYIQREAMPKLKKKTEFYHQDLVGLEVRTKDGEPFGKVLAVHNFGAGDILDIAPVAGGESELYAFTHANFPSDPVNGHIVITPPEVLKGE